MDLRTLPICLAILIIVVWLSPLLFNIRMLEAAIRIFREEQEAQEHSIKSFRIPSGFQVLVYELVIFSFMIVSAVLGQNGIVRDGMVIGLALVALTGAYISILIGLETTAYVCLAVCIGALMTIVDMIPLLFSEDWNHRGWFFPLMLIMYLAMALGFYLGGNREVAGDYAFAAGLGYMAALIVGILFYVARYLGELAVTALAVAGYLCLVGMGVSEAFNRMRIRPILDALLARPGAL